MKLSALEIAGAWVASSDIHLDSRGSFTEWFHLDDISTATGRQLIVAQANHSVSEKGVLRGLHFSLAAQNQSKWINCISGSIQDVLVDFRRNSPSFLKHQSIILNSRQPKYIYIPHGVGHGFLSLEENTIVVYLMSSSYDPNFEYAMNPFDKTLNIVWQPVDYKQSERDLNAKDLAYFSAEDLLPIYAEHLESNN